MIRSLLLSLALFLVACDSSEPNKLSMEDFEGNEGEAVVRHVLKTLPPLEPDVPKVYTVVKGPRLYSTKTAFVNRLSDLKLTFISGEVLTMREPENSIVDPRSGLSPITVQLLEMTRTGANTLDVTAAWAYKKQFERRHYTLSKQSDGSYKVETGERVDGNYAPPLAPATP